MKVTLRKKSMTKDRTSLYLDYYPPFLHPVTGKLTRREFLKIYIFDKPKTSLEKNHNRETMELAENVRAQRQLEVQNKQYGFISDSRRQESFLEYFQKVAAKKRGTNSDCWKMAVRYFEHFSGSDVRFLDLTEPFCDDYREFMLSSPAIGRRRRISHNTDVKT